MDPPSVEKHFFLKHFSIRWSNPTYPNGQIKKFLLQRAKIIGNGCLNELEHGSNPQHLQSFTDITLSDFKNDFFYDSATQSYVYKDTGKDLFDNFGYYIYKVKLFNSVGNIESNWSKPLLNWQFKAPSPPYDLKINKVHSTGFKLQFREPKVFNGLLKLNYLYIQNHSL